MQPPEMPHHSNTLVPVILAGGSNLEAWPNSRINMPIQFQRNGRQTSLFQQTIACIARLPHSHPPIITLPSSALDIARTQLEELNLLPNAQLIVEPVDRGSLQNTILCALLAAGTDQEAVMMVLEASRSPTNWSDFERLAAGMLDHPHVTTNIIACGQPLDRASKSSLRAVQKSGKTEDVFTFQAYPADLATKNRKFEIGGVIFATPRTFLKSVKSFDRAGFETCNRALQKADDVRGMLWPDLNVWSTLPSLNLGQHLATNTDNTLLRPIDLRAGNANSSAQTHRIFQQDCTNCEIQSEGHLLAVSGVENLRIIVTKDATLVAHKDRPDSLAPIISKMRAFERPELFDFPIKQYTWGIQSEIDRSRDFVIARLSVDPGEQIPVHFHSRRTENWHVLSGKGSARIGEKERQLLPGLSYDIPRNTFHGCINTGDEPLTILESQHGRTISESDVSWAQTQIQGQAQPLSAKAL